MAIKVGLVAAGMLMGITVGAALGIHAQDAGDMGGGADLTGVDGSDQAVPPEPTDVVPDPTVGSPVAQLSVWDRLADCEASGDWHSASNPIYKGGLQFDGPTWARHGGLEFAWRADFATREQQIVVGERTLASQGPGAWPVCGPRVGLHR